MIPDGKRNAETDIMRTKTDEKKRIILEGAMAEFGENGFISASMEDVCKRSGISKSTMYRYFKSKEDLFIDVVNMAADEYREKLVLILNSGDSLSNSIQMLGECMALGIPQLIQAHRDVCAEAGKSDLGVRYFERGPLRVRDAVATFLRRWMDRGDLRAGDDTVAATHLLALLESEIFPPALFGVSLMTGEDDHRARVRRACEVFLRGYAPERTEYSSNLRDTMENSIIPAFGGE